MKQLRPDQVGPWMDGEDHRWQRGLVEVEVVDQVAQLGSVFADGRARVGAAIVAGIDPLSFKKVVLNELDVGVKAQSLVVDVTLLGVRADHECRHSQSVTIRIHAWRRYMVVEPAPVVPGEEDRGGLPVWAPHDRVDEGSDVALPG